MNPYKGRGKSTAESKFGAMGLPKGRGKHQNEADADQVERIIGRASGGRLDKFARGGRTKATSVNVVIQPPQQQQQPQSPTPMQPAMPMPPPPPPNAGPPPPGGPPMPGGLLNPVGAPQMPPPMPPMGGPSPMQLARGGRAKYITGIPTKNSLGKWADKVRKNSYHRKDGGGIPTEGGAETGVGRLEKAGK